MMTNSHEKGCCFPLQCNFIWARQTTKSRHFCISFICGGRELAYNVSFLRPSEEICGQPLFRSLNHSVTQKQIGHAKGGSDHRCDRKYSSCMGKNVKKIMEKNFPWASFVSKWPFEMVWSAADEIYTWGRDMHAHICSDCDRLYLLSLFLYLIPFIHSLEVYVDTYSEKSPYEETSLLSSSWIFMVGSWQGWDRLMNKTMSGSFADGRSDWRVAFVPMGELRFDGVCACERSGKWKAPLEGPLQSTLYTRRWHLGVHELFKEDARWRKKFANYWPHWRLAPWRFVALWESQPRTN